LTDDRLAELAQDIREHGLLDKIDLYQGKILDGRGRYRACLMAGVKPEFEVFTGADPLAYVASRNQHRRDLNPSQRAMVAAKIANFKVGANQHSEGLPIGEASKMMNVSSRSTARAKEVLAHGNPELVAAVESGDLTVAAAAALARNQATAASNNSAPSLDSPTASANAPDASTMVEAPTVQVESPSLAEPLSRAAKWPPAFKLPKPGVTFLIGSLTAVVVEVAVKIAATVSAGDEWPDYSRAERGDVVWLSSQACAQAFLHPQFEAAGAYLQGVRFLKVEADDFELPIRNLSEDLRRLHREITTKGPVSCVIIDYFAEYLRFGDTGQTVRRFLHATEALQEFAVDHGAAVILPCQLPTRDDDAVTEAVTAFVSLEAVSAVFLVKRDAKPNRGTLVHVKEQMSLDAKGFPFQLRNRDCVPAVVWDGLARDFRTYIATPIILPSQGNISSGPEHPGLSASPHEAPDSRTVK
jgi:AAA domain